MKTIFIAALIAVSGWIQGSSAAESPLPRRVPPREPLPQHRLENRYRVKPFFDTPLRQVAISRDADGLYLLTGTVSLENKGTDFQNNDGIWLWQSRDLQQWEPLGQVWSIEKQGSARQKEYRLNPDHPAGPPVRGMTAPEVHHIKGNYYITYSLNGQGTGLLKSKTGKLTGPYEDVGIITPDGGSPSLFLDKDGAAYWLWGDGWIARMTDDLTRLADAPRAMIPRWDAKSHNHGEFFPLHPQGFFAYRNPQGKLLIAFGAQNYRNGALRYDAFVMEAETPYGPYGAPKALASDSGEVTVFAGSAKVGYASFSGSGPWALFQDRASAVPLNLGWDFLEGNRMPVITQRGPWQSMVPVVNGMNMNDVQMLNAPDGYYYLCGSVWNEELKFVFRVWRSQNLRDWEEWEIITAEQIPGLAGAVEAWKSGEYKDKFKGLAGCPMDPEIHYLKGNYWVVFNFYFVDQYPGVDLEQLPKGGFLFRSTTGQALGPYEFYCGVHASQISFLEDGDTVYLTRGNSDIRIMTPDLKGFVPETEKWNMNVVEGINFSTDVGMCPLKVDGKFVFFNYNGFSDNRMAYFVADKLPGPFGRPRRASSRAGHGWVTPSKHRKDIYYQINWGTSMMFSFWAASPCLIPLKYELVNGEPTFRSIYDMPVEEARQYQDEIDRLLGPGVWPEKAQ